ncbi:FAD/NAD(P)-binding oxidoreductase [Gordonia sp. (in: high G+C Gram-positive bacteria)]|uniref:NAD(P)/FAD-dependent oxidoreductase n=1 Tax=Gordonia sp. (in: high G+C Gram-positive bacteria) TaxID=84139 RepID=UPI00169DC5FF|nr:FAD/NAD(P)-binding oxidoreductase [Gordonia sp. (in: high G+C Gram-positive bacteria)]NLG48117.1 NAD(P)/FAD-dependent oxidoreductase [Gordonia sp. (in: high G+C Gram-positive bacteria)]
MVKAPVVIVGAGLGGIRLAENLRNGGYAGALTLVGEEQHPPYDRPPLSKTVLTGDDDRVDLKPSEFFGEHDIELRTGSRVVAVDPTAHTVTVEGDGATEQVAYGTLVLATGLVARQFPGTEGVGGVHVIRTVEDALALREEAGSATRAAVIGAGFIGCEVAASLHKLDVPVTLIEPTPAPLSGPLGATIGEMVTRLHVDAGVDLRVGVGVDEVVVEDGRAVGVVLSDGARVDANLVVVGIGGYPDLDYLEGSGIEIADRSVGGGVACDGVGRTSADDVYALGDCANWHDADGRGHRVEHWTHTVDAAALVAAQLLGHPIPHQTVPYFWSDQYGLKFQMLGSPRSDDEVHLVDDDGRKFLAYYSREGLLTGVVGAGRVGKLMKARQFLVTPTPVATLLEG